ncbi:hypothetical protein IC611_04250 [Proteus mirabilis]
MMEPIYIKVYINRIEVRDLHTKKEFSVERHFTHSRMLIGNFYPAIEAIRTALTQIGINPLSFFVEKKCGNSSFRTYRRWIIPSRNSIIQ